MSPEPTFQAWPKIPRLRNRTMHITEKIDGTNAAVGVMESGQVYAQSRKRLITPEADNFGFARWVAENEADLRTDLGVGLHFGEWYGLGIQRGYGLDHKRFALFNTTRQFDGLPDRVDIVPLLRTHTLDSNVIAETLEQLIVDGSQIAPGFMQPEGIVVFDTVTHTCSKVLCESDDIPKGLAA